MSQRDDLLAGAKRCLVEKGYGNTTARDIAAASGAHLASIGYHFGSKDNLMSTALIEATSEWGDKVESAARAAEPEDPAGRLEAVLGQLLAAIPGDRDLLVANIQAIAQSEFDEHMHDSMAAGFDDAWTSFASILLDVPREDVTEEQKHTAGAAVHALVMGYTVQALVRPEATPGGPDIVAGLRALLGAR
ncbi:TetR family transcriptional regulator [Prauserella marina]|uniref:DNA-binding transcriptional regulator, AcrR family n=1 Tax=Prauserella marina TaxID=530584 RepID=A0A222VQ23_9PSEU|nr:TetR/AcrR family transcriptional regulator [Prauserella marina]ASR36007.1 TetR family transcriptional regulator [Prauserella marina]PWV84046.1 TetR family transcriptional regulator [Prauserella marina]SDC31747.1 DNA-binding transcriptional regulator, AcrR family [Prauserella marina]